MGALVQVLADAGVGVADGVGRAGPSVGEGGRLVGGGQEQLGRFEALAAGAAERHRSDLGRWSRYNEYQGDELDTLVTYLEEAADMLEAPALAIRDRPGLVGGALVWGSGIDPAQEDRWQPWTG